MQLMPVSDGGEERRMIILENWLVCNRDRETDRDRQTDRERDRQTERQRQRHTER
jgi:hypothetical protein